MYKDIGIAIKSGASQIIVDALRRHAVRVLLVSGKVYFVGPFNGGSWLLTDHEAEPLWETLESPIIEWKDSRAFVQDLIPLDSKELLTARVYFGSNAYRQLNILIDFLPIQKSAPPDLMDWVSRNDPVNQD